MIRRCPLHEVIHGDAFSVLARLDERIARTCVTSPPYWDLKKYAGDPDYIIGDEFDPEEYVDRLVKVFGEVRRVLTDDGHLWLNLGDVIASARPRAIGAFAGAIKPRELMGLPWRVALALQTDGWYLRGDVVWHKPDAAPDTAPNRPPRSHEYLFLLAKTQQTFFDRQALEMRRSVWTIPVGAAAKRSAHPATFPDALVEPCVLATAAPDDLVLDPFNGSGTTGRVALMHGRRYLGIELDRAYVDESRAALSEACPACTEHKKRDGAEAPPPLLFRT